MNDDSETPADSTSAAHCSDREFGTSRWQLLNKGYTNRRCPRKGLRRVLERSAGHLFAVREAALGTSRHSLHCSTSVANGTSRQFGPMP